MPFTNTTFAEFAFNKLQRKSLTDPSSKDIGNEAIPSFYQAPASEFFGQSVSATPATAVSDGVAQFFTAAVFVADPSSNGRAFFLQDSASGSRLLNCIPPTYSESHTAFEIVVTLSDSTTLAVLDSRDWYYNYDNGVFFQETADASPTVSTAAIYQYVGKTVQDRLDDLTTSVALDDVSDVSISAATSGQALVYTGTSWVNSSIASGGGGIDTETAQDITGAMITGTSLITPTYNDAAGTLSLTVNESSINHDNLTNFTTTEHFLISAISITGSQVSDLTESVQDISGAMITGGSGIVATYDDGAGTISLTVDFQDSQKATFGTDNDVSIHFNNTDGSLLFEANTHTVLNYSFNASGTPATGNHGLDFNFNAGAASGNNAGGDIRLLAGAAVSGTGGFVFISSGNATTGTSGYIMHNVGSERKTHFATTGAGIFYSTSTGLNIDGTSHIVSVGSVTVMAISTTRQVVFDASNSASTPFMKVQRNSAVTGNTSTLFEFENVNANGDLSIGFKAGASSTEYRLWFDENLQDAAFYNVDNDATVWQYDKSEDELILGTNVGDVELGIVGTTTVYKVFPAVDAGYDLGSTANSFRLVKAEQGEFTDSGVLTQVDTSNISNPPTDAELDAAFGTPGGQEGLMVVVDDNNSGNNVFLCIAAGSQWWYLSLTAAV